MLESEVKSMSNPRGLKLLLPRPYDSSDLTAMTSSEEERGEVSVLGIQSVFRFRGFWKLESIVYSL